MKPRSRASLIFAIGLVASSLAIGNPAAARDYVWNAPSGAVCTGGNTSGPTVGLLMRETGAYDHLPIVAQQFADHIYIGTTCTQRVHLSGRAPLPGQFNPAPTVFGTPIVGVDPGGSVATSPYGSCNPPSGGCVTATAIFSSTADSLSFHYTAEIIMELDSYDGATGSWAANATNFHNNHGNSWGMSISSGTWYPSGYVRYWTDAYGTGSYQYWNIDPGIQAANYYGEQVHMGYQATLTINFPGGGQSSQPYCFYGDFQAYNAGVIGGGWCANP